MFFIFKLKEDMCWIFYHIENYFLESKFTARVLSSLNMGATLTEEAITDELRQCAQDTFLN